MTATFWGWVRRPSGRWRRVAQGPTEAAVWRVLLDVKAEGTGVDKAVLAAGRTPSKPDVGR